MNKEVSPSAEPTPATYVPMWVIFATVSSAFVCILYSSGALDSALR